MGHRLVGPLELSSWGQGGGWAGHTHLEPHLDHSPARSSLLWMQPTPLFRPPPLPPTCLYILPWYTSKTSSQRCCPLTIIHYPRPRPKVSLLPFTSSNFFSTLASHSASNWKGRETGTFQDSTACLPFFGESVSEIQSDEILIFDLNSRCESSRGSPLFSPVSCEPRSSDAAQLMVGPSPPLTILPDRPLPSL